MVTETPQHAAGHLAIAAYRDRGSIPAPPAGFTEDASRLETIAVETHVVPARGTEDALLALFSQARAAGRPIAIAGALQTGALTVAS